MGENIVSNFQDDFCFAVVKDYALDRIILPKGSIAEKLKSICKKNIENPEYDIYENPAIKDFSVVYENWCMDFHSVDYFFNDGIDLILCDEASEKLFRVHTNTGAICQLFCEDRPDVCVGASFVGVVPINGKREMVLVMLYRQPGVSTKGQEGFTAMSSIMYLLVQHLIMDRPVALKERVEKSRYRIHAPGTPEHRKRVVKLVKTVYVDAETLTEQIVRHFTCECWGVIGHVRTYKSGKKVWIKPYRKGKERNNPDVYCSKDYVAQAV